MGLIYGYSGEFTLGIDRLKVSPERICEGIFGSYIKKASKRMALWFRKI